MGIDLHSYHLVDPGPWPISGSLGALATTVGGVMYMHSFQWGATLFSLGLIFLLYTMFVWWRDVLRESTLEENFVFPTLVFADFTYATLEFDISGLPRVAFDNTSQLSFHDKNTIFKVAIVKHCQSQ